MMKEFKRIFVCISIILFVVLINTTVFAQEKVKRSAVQFKDGSVVQGNIVEINNRTIKIETDSGKIVIRQFDDIVSVEDYVDEKKTTEAKEGEKTENFSDKADGEKTEKSSKEPLIAKHTWEIGPEISHIRYEEPSLNVEENGIMYGIGASYAYHNGVMLKGEIGYSYGYVDYKNSGETDNIEDYLFEMRVLAGYDFSIYESSIITPYIGFGYRWLYDDWGGMTTSTGANGYDRESQYYYIPIGIETLSDISNGWFFGITAEFDYFLEGRQTSYLSNADPGYNDIENKQKDGHGFRGSLKFQKKGERIGYIIEPFVRYWKIDKSEVENIYYNGALWGYGWEPENKSTQFGIIFTAVF